MATGVTNHADFAGVARTRPRGSREPADPLGRCAASGDTLNTGWSPAVTGGYNYDPDVIFTPTSLK